MKRITLLLFVVLFAVFGLIYFVRGKKATKHDVVVHAWGNSQTQGFGLRGCHTFTCHPDTAWPAIFAAKMEWDLDNQAYGSSDCADLTYRGTSESLWDMKVDANSRNIYAHFRNDQSQYGGKAYRIEYAVGCIAAQTAWLAVPDTDKVRATAAAATGNWFPATQNSAGSFTMTAGATKTFLVSGETVYIATARLYGDTQTKYSVTVDGAPVAQLSQDLDAHAAGGFPVSENIVQNFIRVTGLENRAHKVIYTCVEPYGAGCYVFYAAGVKPYKSGPIVYSLSPIYNAHKQQEGYMDATTNSAYHLAWMKMVSELTSDGLNIVGLDATDPKVYDPDTQSQKDGVHQNVSGHRSIGEAMYARATGR